MGLLLQQAINLVLHAGKALDNNFLIPKDCQSQSPSINAWWPWSNSYCWTLYCLQQNWSVLKVGGNWRVFSGFPPNQSVAQGRIKTPAQQVQKLLNPVGIPLRRCLRHQGINPTLPKRDDPKRPSNHNFFNHLAQIPGEQPKSNIYPYLLPDSIWHKAILMWGSHMNWYSCLADAKITWPIGILLMGQLWHQAMNLVM